MANTINYWWMPRPKRKLNTVPQVLGAFSVAAMSSRNDAWSGNHGIQIAFEEELEKEGLKRIGERRDHSGSGGRTYQAWLACLGLIFIQDRTGLPYLTLAGEALLGDKPPVEILKNQVLKYQFPSAYSLKTHVNPEFRIHPFIFILKLLMDKDMGYLTENEIAKVVIENGTNESDKCFRDVKEKILQFRTAGEASLSADFFDKYKPARGNINPEYPYRHLTDVANTIACWLEYTQLIIREENGTIRIADEKRDEVQHILDQKMPFIPNPENAEQYQRRYGLDPWHRKDTRNLIQTRTVSTDAVMKQRVKSLFLAYASKAPVSNITPEIIAETARLAGVSRQMAEDLLMKEFPHGAVGGFMANYYEMAFRGRDDAVDFEIATTSIFRDVFHYNAIHLGQTGRNSAPDILLLSDSAGYQSIIDTKAYSEYSVTGDHHNRMVHNYIEHISNYSNSPYPIGYFAYIAGGFTSGIDKQIKSEVDESHTSGSCITVNDFIKMVQIQGAEPYSHEDLRRIFGVCRQVHSADYTRHG